MPRKNGQREYVKITEQKDVIQDISAHWPCYLCIWYLRCNRWTWSWKSGCLNWEGGLLTEDARIGYAMQILLSICCGKNGTLGFHVLESWTVSRMGRGQLMDVFSTSMFSTNRWRGSKRENERDMSLAMATGRYSWNPLHSGAYFQVTTCISWSLVYERHVGGAGTGSFQHFWMFTSSPEQRGTIP